MFILHILVRFPPIFVGKHNWMQGFHQPSKMRFLRFRLQYLGSPCPPLPRVEKMECDHGGTSDIHVLLLVSLPNQNQAI